MRTTVKLSAEQAITVEPGEDGGVILSIVTLGGQYTSREVIGLTADRAGALLFGIEQAGEAARIAQERASLTA